MILAKKRLPDLSGRTQNNRKSGAQMRDFRRVEMVILPLLSRKMSETGNLEIGG